MVQTRWNAIKKSIKKKEDSSRHGLFSWWIRALNQSVYVGRNQRKSRCARNKNTVVAAGAWTDFLLLELLSRRARFKRRQLGLGVESLFLQLGEEDFGILGDALNLLFGCERLDRIRPAHTSALQLWSSSRAELLIRVSARTLMSMFTETPSVPFRPDPSQVYTVNKQHRLALKHSGGKPSLEGRKESRLKSSEFGSQREEQTALWSKEVLLFLKNTPKLKLPTKKHKSCSWHLIIKKDKSLFIFNQIGE